MSPPTLPRLACSPRAASAVPIARQWRVSARKWQVSVRRVAVAAAASGSGHERRKDVAASMLQSVVTLALKSQLRQCGHIDVDVDGDVGTLLDGRIRGARCLGHRWQSPLNLTARMLDVRVGEVSLDYGALAMRQQIVLRHASRGSARVLFSEDDFGGFLAHPLVVRAARGAVQGAPFTFRRNGVVLSTLPSPTVAFSGTWSGNGNDYHVNLLPHVTATSAAVSAAAGTRSGHGSIAATEGGGGGVQVAAVAASGSGRDDATVSADLTAFFNNLLINLDGVHLKLAALHVAEGDHPPLCNHPCDKPLVDLRLSVHMVAFPPLDMRF